MDNAKENERIIRVLAPARSEKGKDEHLEYHPFSHLGDSLERKEQ